MGSKEFVGAFVAGSSDYIRANDEQRIGMLRDMIRLNTLEDRALAGRCAIVFRHA